MSKYGKLIGEILDSIYEGYTLDEKTKKLKVVNESKAERAAESVHTLVLEKARELWDQLEASEESLADVAEEISFEELNTDPASMDLEVSGSRSSGTETTKDDGEDLSSMLGEASDFDLDSIFDSMDHLDDEEGDMPYNEELGDEEGDVVDGDEEFSDLKMDSDNGYEDDELGDDDLGGDLEGDDFGDDELGGDLEGDLGGDDDLGDDDLGGDDLEGDDNGFDFDLGLDSEEPEMEENGDSYPEGSDYDSPENSFNRDEREDYDFGSDNEEDDGGDLDYGDENPEDED